MAAALRSGRRTVQIVVSHALGLGKTAHKSTVDSRQFDASRSVAPQMGPFLQCWLSFPLVSLHQRCTGFFAERPPLVAFDLRRHSFRSFFHSASYFCFRVHRLLLSLDSSTETRIEYRATSFIHSLDFANPDRAAARPIPLLYYCTILEQRLTRRLVTKIQTSWPCVICHKRLFRPSVVFATYFRRLRA